MGTEARTPTAAELARMRDELGAALAAGARGFSTGLSYAPGMFADRAEVAALAAVAARAGRPYHTHMRDGDAGIRATSRRLSRRRRTRARRSTSATSTRARGPADEPDWYLERIERARRDGPPVTFDLTVFPRGGGAWPDRAGVGTRRRPRRDRGAHRRSRHAAPDRG
ncbi:MAG: hypothetical protein U0869_25150 [Chloroflexota bacterium]